MTSLTNKELSYIYDLLTYESEATKKAKLYSKILTDENIASAMATIAKNHEKRFESIINIL